MDRCIQDIIRTAIEPIAEYHFNPKRSCHDAIGHLFSKMSRISCPQWVIEGDIKGCFDHIDHESILNKMKDWNLPKPVRRIVKNMLKSGIIRSDGYEESVEGTPQGGVLSPLLSNVALSMLDEWGENQKGVNPVIRYADDFVIVCKTRKEAEERKEEIKTRITNIHDGFNFLGFHCRKYQEQSPLSKYHKVGKLLIKPQNGKVKQHLTECGKTIRKAKGQNLQYLLRKLNPKLKGFANYYRFVVSRESFEKISNAIWWKVYRWLCKSHPTKSKKWVRDRYKTEYSPLKKTETFQQNGLKLFKPQMIPITRYTKVKSGMRVYDNSDETRNYWEERTYNNSLNSIYSIKVEKLFLRQHGLCPICRKQITGNQIQNYGLEQHHLNPQSIGENHKLTNLRLIHMDCHSQLHRILSLKEMERLTSQGIDYCNKDYLYKTYV